MAPPDAAADEPLAMRVYRHVWDLVNSGELAPGTRLREQELASKLDVSRTPVREAFRRLESDGILESRSPRGFVVANPEREALTAYLIRQELEGLAARMAAERVTVQQLRDLDDLLTEMEELAPAWPRSIDRMAAMHAEFHDTINQLADSAQLYKFIAQVSPFPVLQQVMRSYDRESLARSMAGHRAILKALWDRDGDRAQHLVHEHLEHSKPVIVRLDAGSRHRRGDH
ncbi:MAG TPA: GntR family transcriptional regulator [Nakamurella sp.]|jgi:DNA-binding GntR family transcriptional regulator|nr:GntR family transcriptional regulator [Nakamurella sp.]